MNREDIRGAVKEGPESQQALLARLRRLSSGRRVANLCLFAWLASAAFRVMESPFGALFFLCVIAASVVAVIRMAANLSTPPRYGYLYIAASFVPLANFIPVIFLSMRAGKELRAAGFSVGMLDAQERKAV